MLGEVDGCHMTRVARLNRGPNAGSTLDIIKIIEATTNCAAWASSPSMLAALECLVDHGPVDQSLVRREAGVSTNVPSVSRS